MNGHADKFDQIWIEPKGIKNQKLKIFHMESSYVTNLL
jgi:hypothetical protein